MNLNKNLLFNPILTRNTEEKIIGGITNGIMNLSSTKYPWAISLYKVFLGNFWIPSEQSLTNDVNSYNNLTIEEKEAFKKVLSFLIFLDSLVVNALPHMMNYVTSRQVSTLLSAHQFFETIHAKSYEYILASCVNAEIRKEIYDIACNDTNLIKRNQYISSFHSNFINNPTEENFIFAVVGQLIIESLTFFSGFCFFHNLAKNNKMTETDIIISFIQRDEASHVSLFTHIYKTLEKENSQYFTEDNKLKFIEMFKIACEEEIEWCHYAYGDNIEGLTKKSIELYLKWLTNKRLKDVGLKKLYPEATKNPLPFIEQMSKPNMIKQDFFEGKPINYSKAGKELALDDLDNMEF